MQENKTMEKKEFPVFSTVIYISLALSAIIAGCLSGLSVIATLSRLCYLMVLGAIFLILLYYQDMTQKKQISNIASYLIFFVVSVLLMAISSKYSIGIFWMLLLTNIALQTKGISIKVSSYGMMMITYLVLNTSITSNFKMLEYALVFGAVLMLLLSNTKYFKELGYVLVILFSLSVALLLILNGFDFDFIQSNPYAVILEWLSLLFLIIYASLFMIAKESKVQTIEESIKESTESSNQQLDSLLSEDFELLQLLMNHRDEYQHALKVSHFL